MSAAPQKFLPTGTEIGDRYVIESVLAAGGVGIVYLARDRMLGRPVAVKLLLERAELSEADDIRFRREARALAALQNPNIVAIYAYGKLDGKRYIVMEHVDGPSLFAVLAKDKRLPVATALDVTRQVAIGLAEVHAAGLVHRDIKPANILLRRLATGGVHAKIVDFGLSRLSGPTEPLQATLGFKLPGTPTYMSPEQLMRRPLDGRSDLYSLGVVLFEMLTGTPPFPRSLGAEQSYAHVGRPPPLLHDVWPDAWPEPVQFLVSRMLAKSPDDRFRSPSDLARAIDSLV